MAADRPLELVRRERALVGLWIVLAILLWNGIYDMTVGEGIKEYLFRHAMSEAGVAPAVPLASHMETTVRHAAEVGVLWAALILLAGVATLRLVRPARG